MKLHIHLPELTAGEVEHIIKATMREAYAIEQRKARQEAEESDSVTPQPRLPADPSSGRRIIND